MKYFEGRRRFAKSRDAINQFLAELPPGPWHIADYLKWVLWRRKLGLKNNLLDLIWIHFDYFLRAKTFVWRYFFKSSYFNLGQYSRERERSRIAKVKYTITFGSRRIGNRDNRLRAFLKSFLDTANHPELAEFHIKLDIGDDLAFFRKIHDEFSPVLNLFFHVTPRGQGYYDMHKWHAKAVEMRAPNSRFLFILTDDAHFKYKGWDTSILNSIEGWKSQYFIGSQYSWDIATAIFGPNPAEPIPVYWSGGDDFPIFSFALLDSFSKTVQNLDRWTCLGNSYVVDGFCGDLIRRIFEQHAIPVLLRLPDVTVRLGRNVWTSDRGRSQVRSLALLDFFGYQNVQIRNKMAYEAGIAIKQEGILKSDPIDTASPLNIN